MQLAAIDALLAQPFPEAESRDGTGGPGHLVLTLRQTRDFWDDVGYEAAAYAELEAELAALAAALTARWGPPATVDLSPYLRAGLEGERVAEPFGHLSQYATSLLVWTQPESPRWLALTIGQGDKELPMELFAAVGEADFRP